jgi:hypothetical protein
MLSLIFGPGRVDQSGPTSRVGPNARECQYLSQQESLNEWLSKKRENSVVYIALGTEVTLSQELMHELAHGIEKSRLPFIWVVKNAGPDVIPSGFETSVFGPWFCLDRLGTSS